MDERNAGSPSVMPRELLRHFHLYAQPSRQRLRRCWVSRGIQICGPVRSLPQRLMFAPACVLINVLALAVIAIAVHRAPEGYEDETGFHFTDRVVPRSKGRDQLLPLILGTIGSIPDLLL